VAVVADENALEILGRRASLVRGRNADYSTSRLVVPLGALDGVALAGHSAYPDVTTVMLRAGAWSTHVRVSADSGAERLLSAASATGKL